MNCYRIWTIAVYTIVALLVCSGHSGAQESRSCLIPAGERKELVAVGLFGTDVLIATPKDSMTSGEPAGYTSCACNEPHTGPVTVWRYRVLHFASGRRIVDVALARTGTKLAVLYAPGPGSNSREEHEVFDLSVAGDPQPVATHVVPHQLYYLSGQEGRQVVLDDQNREQSVSEKDPALKESLAPAERSAELASLRNGLCLLEKKLPQEIRRQKTEQWPWRFFYVVAEPHLYAPVLEFASTETVFPSKTDIWGPLKETSNHPFLGVSRR